MYVDPNKDDLKNLSHYTFHIFVNSMYIFQGKENLGMVMVFTLVSAGQEWLNVKWDSIQRDREEKVLAKKKADEEAEMVRTAKHILIAFHR